VYYLFLIIQYSIASIYMEVLLSKENIIKQMISDSEYKRHTDVIWNLLKSVVPFDVHGSLIPVNTPLAPIYRHINNNKFRDFLCQLIKILNPIEYSYETDITSGIIYNTDNVSNLKNDGVLIYSDVIDRVESESITNSANNKIFHQGNSHNNNFNLYDPENKGVWWFTDRNTHLYHNEAVQKILTDENLLRIAHSYFNTTPILHSINFWASYPGERDCTHRFHQDWDDIKFLKVFVYLNDIGSDNGPHFYVKNSLHKIVKKDTLPRGHAGSARVDDSFFENYQDDIMEITGNTGTLIVEDTNGFHRGSRVKTGKRYILQLLFGVSRTFELLESGRLNYTLNKKKSNKLYEAKQKYPFIYQHFRFE